MERILTARIIPAPPMTDLRAVLEQGGQHRILATFEAGGPEQEVLRYYGDEISFTVEEVVGKTAAELRDLRHQKDVAYLQS